MGSVREIVLEELLERRVVLVLKIGVKLLKTVYTAWRHGTGRQAPYQRCEGCSGSRKTLFFVLFAQQGPPDGSTVPPGATSSLLGVRRHHFSSLRSFRKTAFPDLLTV